MTLDPKEVRYLHFIHESILLVQQYVGGTREEFMADPMTQDAVVWRLQSIADAARNHLSDGLKDRHPDIRWRAVYGFRNIAAHGYAGLNLDLVWEIAAEHLEPLRRVAREELEGES
ncbi:MAG TPA: HepT-like ribonuclease domain-containing protein [Candidatus Dormibacteraeota bacterium]|nr:HepT-like ribonuclease domain-containing protein [Candidatus Dormibacteraeota bacterium]